MDCKLRAKNCGGCPMLATEYAAQLKKKEADVRALLGKYGPVSPIRGMETPYHYRNKVISTFAPAAGGKLTSGIYAARTHKVLPVESCLLQDEVLDKVMLAVRAAACWRASCPTTQNVFGIGAHLGLICAILCRGACTCAFCLPRRGKVARRAG